MKSMPLMDMAHAWSFATKVGGRKITPRAAEVQRILRTKLRTAERFSLDNDAVKLITRLSHEQERMEGWSVLARLPYDVMWVEYDLHVHLNELVAMGKNRTGPDDYDSPERLGFLLYRDSTDPNCPRWIAHTFVEFDHEGVASPEWFCPVFDPEGDAKWPIRGSQFWNKPTLSLRPNFPKMKVHMDVALKSGDALDADGKPFTLPEGVDRARMEIECDAEVMLAGMVQTSNVPGDSIRVKKAVGADGKHRIVPETDLPLLKGPEWLMPRLAATLDPWWDALFENEPDVINKHAIKQINESAGGTRWLIAMLAAINGLPRDVRWREPRTGRHSVGMYTMPYFGSSTIELTVPRENRLIHAKRMLDKAGKHARHLRRHKVIGHWRVIDRGKPRNYICRHIPAITERNHAICERCQMLVTWIESHERGDATLGIVNHDYEVKT